MRRYVDYDSLPVQFGPGRQKTIGPTGDPSRTAQTGTGMPLQIFSIARNTFIESLRQPVCFVLVILCGVLLFLSTWQTGFSMGSSSSAEVSGDNKLLLDIGLATVFVCGMLLAAFLATSAISREIENKTVLTVVSKPISRPALVLGKYVGVSAALLIASAIMLLFLLMAIRHGVMSTASDKLDEPVIVFTFAAVLGSIVLGGALNFWYGWSFTQTAVLLMLPAMMIAYAIVLFVDKEWNIQPFSYKEYLYREFWYTEARWADRFPEQSISDAEQIRVRYGTFRPQITLACYCLILAVLVLSAVATAASTRLGQVMTIVVCSGVFLFGLLSNHLLGQRAFENDPIAEIQSVAFPDPTQTDLSELGSSCTVTLPPDTQARVRVGDSFYWGPSPTGMSLATGEFPAFEGDPTRDESLFGPGVAPRIIVTNTTFPEITIRHIGARPLAVDRPPAAGDYAFLTPTKTSGVVAAMWTVVPNMHYFWLIDAISQNVRIPFEYVAGLTIYALAQIGAFLGLGVILFQRRDVG